jgi:hypothetical protein
MLKELIKLSKFTIDLIIKMKFNNILEEMLNKKVNQLIDNNNKNI